MFKKINFLIFGLVVAIGFSACMKDDIEVYDFEKFLQIEAPVIEAYVKSVPELQGAVRDSATGIWFKVIDEGLQDKEDLEYYGYNINNSNRLEYPSIRAKYTGKLVESGAVFQESEIKTLTSLVSLLSAWQIAFFPKNVLDKQGKPNFVGGLTEKGLQKGSKIRIVLPSPYGYQSQAQQSIPANSPLDFYIEVLEVRPPGAPSAN